MRYVARVMDNRKHGAGLLRKIYETSDEGGFLRYVEGRQERPAPVRRVVGYVEVAVMEHDPDALNETIVSLEKVLTILKAQAATAAVPTEVHA
jgi:hypothetical protein